MHIIDQKKREHTRDGSGWQQGSEMTMMEEQSVLKGIDSGRHIY
jgi:hypothetical protein